MATGTTFKEVVNSIGHNGEDQDYSHDEIREYLLQHRLNFKLIDYLTNPVEPWSLFISVISNEQKGYTHIVYWDGHELFDPIAKEPGGEIGWGVVAIYSIFKDITKFHTQNE